MAEPLEDKKINPAPEHRRMGAAFDILSKTLRKVVLIVFGNGFTIRNRPGLNIDRSRMLQTGLVDVKSMMEMYYEAESLNGINALVIGRTGNGEKRNMHFMDIALDHRTEIGDSLGYVNGVYRVRVSRDGADETIRDGLYVMDRGSESASREGSINWLVAAGEGGQVRLSYMPNRDGNPLTDAIYDVYITANGIFMFGLPTSSVGLSSGAIWNDAGTLKII